MRCVEYNPTIEVTICDLPQQIGLMRKATQDKAGSERIHGVGMNILDEKNMFPTDKRYDVIWTHTVWHGSRPSQARPRCT